MRYNKIMKINSNDLRENACRLILEISMVKVNKIMKKTNSKDCDGKIICENDIVAFSSKRAKLERKKFDCIGIVKFADCDGKKDFVVKEIFSEGNEYITKLDYADEFLIKIVKGEY